MSLTQTRPLYELVTSRDFVGSDRLKTNLRRALMEYLDENSACRCSPCYNNGIAILKGQPSPRPSAREKSVLGSGPCTDVILSLVQDHILISFCLRFRTMY